jgi:SHS2 domain-containing protein
MKKDYKFINHTADVAITVRGGDLQSLFKNSGDALIDLLFNDGEIKGINTYTITAEGDNEEELLINFLRELFFQFAVYRVVLKEIEFEEFSKTGVTAKVTGEEYDPNRHKLNIDIKAVTYHNVEIKKADDELTVSIVFDT